MKTFRDILPKPSDAVQAMIDGLEKFDKEEGFKIEMATFGSVDDKGMCFGCAATCAAQYAANITFLPNQIADFPSRAFALKGIGEDLHEFESVIEWLRKGDLSALGSYYETLIPCYPFKLPILISNTWKDWLPEYKKLVQFLKENDL